MGEMKRDRRNDTKYRKQAAVFDPVPIVSISESIKDLRSIYKNLDDRSFAKWYEHRYGINHMDVLDILKRSEVTDTTA